MLRWLAVNVSARAQLASLGGLLSSQILSATPLPETQSPQRLRPVVMSLANSFPHAYDYIKKHPYSPEELKALYKLTHLFSVDTILNSSIAPVIRSGPTIVAGLGGPDGVKAKVYYWEVTINYTESHGRQLKLVNVGFESHQHRVLYRSDGRILGLFSIDTLLQYDGRESSGSSVNAEPFGSGDVIGCGICENECQVFFTKNGRRIAAVQSWALRFKSCRRPCLITTEKSTTFSLNHGDAPFEFDICGRTIHPSKLTKSLPQELFQIVVRHRLYNSNVAGIQDIKAIHRLSTVCRYCYKMCRNFVQQKISLTSHQEMSAATCLRLLSRTLGLVTQEDVRSPWLHILFTQSHPGLTQNWTCDYNYCELRLPPSASADLHTFVRSSGWNSLSELELRRRKFKSWTQFAKLVLSLPHLERLTISRVDWGYSPEVPPSWLRFLGRLRSFLCSGSEITGPHSWVFISGQPAAGTFRGPALSADTIPVTAQIFEAVIKGCVLPVDILKCEHDADDSYRITGFNHLDNHPTKALEFVLAPANKNYHRLSNIRVGEANANLPAMIERLSSLAPGFQSPNIEIETLFESPCLPRARTDKFQLTSNFEKMQRFGVKKDIGEAYIQPLAYWRRNQHSIVVPLRGFSGSLGLQSIVECLTSPILLEKSDREERHKSLCITTLVVVFTIIYEIYIGESVRKQELLLKLLTAVHCVVDTSVEHTERTVEEMMRCVP